jgi:sugar lactone lactonase YvrE
MKTQLISQVVSELGESPIYNQTKQEAMWTDITGLKWFKHSFLSGETIMHKSGGMIGALAIREKSGYVAAVEEGFATLEENEEYLVTNKILDKSQRMNDGKCDVKGRFWAGSTNLDFKEARGKLFRLDIDFKCEVMLDDLTLPNGMDWSPDNEHFYLIDSLDYKLWKFDFEVERGMISNRTIFYEFDPTNGIPDGLSVSSQGHVLVAMYEGSSIQVISPNGVLDDTFQLPVKNPTSCTFIGKNLENLLVTSAYIGREDGSTNFNGRTLLLSEFGLRGKYPYKFRG